MVTIPSMLQAPLQCLLRPAMWIPGIRNIHSHKVTWESDKPSIVVLKALVSAIDAIKQKDDTGAYYDIHKVNTETFFLRIFCFTRAEWLDIVEIKVKEGSIQAKSFSSGFLPLFIPFAFILNCAFFWVPFYDNKLNKARLELIKQYTDVAITGGQTTSASVGGRQQSDISQEGGQSNMAANSDIMINVPSVDGDKNDHS